MSISLGLPKGLLPTPEVAMSAGCVSQLVRVQPNNIASIVSPAQVLPATANTGNNSLTFPSQLVSFSVPTGQGKHVWIDSDKSTVSLRVNYQVSTAGSTMADCRASLQGSATSFFNRIVHIGPNGQTIDDVVNLHVSEHINQLLNLNSPDRDCFAPMYGFDATAGTNTVQGHAIDSLAGTAANTAANCYYSYEFPLPSALLGKYAKSMFPCGSVSKLDVQLYTNSFVPITYSNTTAGTTGPTITITIDNISLNLWMITLDTESARLLGAPRIHSIHGITQRTATGTIAAGSSGYINTLIGLRGKSCRNLFTRFVDQGAIGTLSAGASSAALNGWADSKALLCSQLNYLLAGKDRYPQFPHNTQILPASVFSRTLMASEMYELWMQHSSFMPLQFFKYAAVGSAPTAAGGYDQRLVAAGATTSSLDLATFVFGEDLRKAHSSAALDGIDLTITANHFLETNILVAPSNSQSVYFTGFFDIIFECDMESGTISYRM
jgi:hypothetical protein